MKLNVKGHIFDLLAFRGLPGKRKKRIARSPASPMPAHPVNELAAQLHPEALHLVIQEVRDETHSSRSYRLGPDPVAGTKTLPYFRAGQYLSLKVPVGDVRITRPYSISSAPFQALGANGFYEITLKRVEGGFLSEHAWQNWSVGTKLESSAPVGFFYYEPLRDAPSIVGLAGGSGITPFRSMAREIVSGGLDARLLLLYGSSDEGDILFYDELNELQQRAPDKVRVVHVLSCELVTLPGCELGFITAEVMRKYADVDHSSFFVCGPQVMYEFVRGELAKLELPLRRIRREAFGEVKEIAHYPGFPSSMAGATFQMKVHLDSTTSDVTAMATETLLVAMERAKLAPPSQCRSGECGFCRSLLLKGDVFVVPDGDGRRAADKKLGFIHPCSTYPLSDVELSLTSRNPSS